MTLVFIFGPPALGKMTVGLELERLTGFRLPPNHMTVNPVVRMNTRGTFFYPDRHLRIDNTELEPASVAQRIVGHFRLPLVETRASDRPGKWKESSDR